MKKGVLSQYSIITSGLILEVIRKTFLCSSIQGRLRCKCKLLLDDTRGEKLVLTIVKALMRLEYSYHFYPKVHEAYPVV